jgi:dipeptidyl aminopeptidase/acylaminoacyl peptidase
MNHRPRSANRPSAFRLNAILLLMLLPLAAAAQAQPAPKRAITHEDLIAFKRLGATAVSPDGRWIVVAVTEPAYDEDARRNDLWIVPADGSKPPRALTAGKGGEGDPAWSPDSTRLAFTAKREGDDLSQVYVLPIEGGEARRVSNASGGAATPVWSPDGRALLFTSFVYPQAKDEADNKRIVAERKALKYNLRAYDGFPIRHWDRWLDERRPTLMLQSLDAEIAPRDLLAGTALRSGAGFGGRLGNEGETIDAAFTPDGREVVFTASSNRSSGAAEEIVQSLWLVPVTGGEPRRLTEKTGDYAAPQFTPDGATLLAQREAAGGRWVFNRTQLVAWSWPISGQEREVAPDFDLSVGNYVIAPDSRTIWFVAEHHGHDRLHSVPLTGGKPVQVGEMPSGGVSRLAIGGAAESPVLAGLWGSAASPVELVRIDPSSGARTTLTSFNAAKLAELDLAPVEEFWFEARTGARVHNVLIKPPGFDPNRKYPLFVLIHGGPHGMWKDEISYRWK